MNIIEYFIGIIAGIIGGLGMGGGTILILLLTMFLNIEQNVAQGSNVVFFIPMAITAIIIYIKNKNINFKVAIPICIWGLVGTIVGSILSTKLEIGILRKCFGIFLIITAIYQAYSLYKRYIKLKNRNNSKKII